MGADVCVEPADDGMQSSASTGSLPDDQAPAAFVPLELSILTMGGTLCCVLRIDSIAARIADVKAQVERAAGIPYSEQELVADGCPVPMHDSCRLAHYVDVLYGSRRIYLVRRLPADEKLDRCASNRLRREFQLLSSAGAQLRANEGFELAPASGSLDVSPLHWVASIDGPKGGPYEGGVFHIDLFLSSNYPYRPPRVVFGTRIFHPLVSGTGTIDLNILHEHWSPVVTLASVLKDVRTALQYPHAPSDICTGCGNAEAALLSRDPVAFDERARECTQAFAAAAPGW